MNVIFIVFIIACLISIFLFSRCPQCKPFSLFLKDAESHKKKSTMVRIDIVGTIQIVLLILIWDKLRQINNRVK